jgi:putative chitinase
MHSGGRKMMTQNAMKSGRPVLRRGSEGASVTVLQSTLAILGFDPGPTDGSFGPMTEAAVIAFQRAHALAVDGIVGAQTWGKLDEISGQGSQSSSGGSGPLLRRGARGEAVRALQQRLNALGFNVGAVDGDFGPATEAGVTSFQRSRGLSVDGVVGPQTWRALGIQVVSEGLGSAGGVTLEQLRAIMSMLSDARARECLPHLNRALDEAQIDNRMRRAAFLAQLAHESGELKYFEEIADGNAYEGRADLGNTQPGDGRRYKGRGPIQLTGRSNYRAAGRALNLDLEGHPERVADVDVGFRVAGWYWTSRNLNPLADAGNFTEITRRINGGQNGQSSRERYYRRALDVL